MTTQTSLHTETGSPTGSERANALAIVLEDHAVRHSYHRRAILRRTVR